MKTYHFTVTIQGEGQTPEEAWADAVAAFEQDPGEPHEVEQVVVDGEFTTLETNKSSSDDYNPNDPSNW